MADIEKSPKKSKKEHKDKKNKHKRRHSDDEDEAGSSSAHGQVELTVGGGIDYSKIKGDSKELWLIRVPPKVCHPFSSWATEKKQLCLLGAILLMPLWLCLAVRYVFA